jgi:argininosuccinate synthase
VKKINKVVLAYSGGLDTSAMLLWLKRLMTARSCAIAPMWGRAKSFRAWTKRRKRPVRRSFYVEDLREEFVRDFVWTAVKANALYEGVYLLGTSLARPVIAKRQIEIAQKEGADAVAHGATGKETTRCVLS